MNGDILILITGLLAMGWIFHAAIMQSKVRALEGAVKFLENENAELRRRASN